MNSLLAIPSVPLFLCLSLIPNNGSNTDLVPDVTQSPPLPDGYVTYPDIGFAYKVHSDVYTDQSSAEELCVLEGGHLAVIDSEKKLEYALRPPIVGSLSKRHVGIRKVNDEWVSIVDGTTLTSVPWAKDQPFSRNDYNCAMVAFAMRGRRIMTVPCTYFFGDFVCQIPLQNTADVV